MWSIFVVDCLYLSGILFVPGVLLASSFGKKGWEAVCFAPVLSMCLLFSVSTAFVLAGISTSGIGIALASLFVSLVFFGFKVLYMLRNIGLHGKGEGRGAIISRNAKSLALCLVVSISVGVFVYILPLDGAESFFQGYDNYYHLSQIRGYLTTGYYASLPITQYPNLWHSIAANVASFGAGQVCVAANAVNFVLTSVVVPLSVFSLVAVLFRGIEKSGSEVMPFAAVAISLSSTFPWSYVCSGPLYALLAGWAVLPLSLSLFISLVEGKRSIKLLPNCFLFCITLFGLLVGHPSTVFAAVVFLVPFCVQKIWKGLAARTKGLFAPLFACGLFIALVVAMWGFCLESSLFAGVVSFTWPQVCSFSQALFSATLMALRPSYFPQIVFALCILIGSAECVFKRSHVWLIFSFILVLILYAVSIGTSDAITRALVGFWYSDSNRMAAFLGFAGIPLAAIGLCSVYRFVVRHYAVLCSVDIEKTRASRAAMVVVFVPVFLLTFFPSFNLSGVGSVKTGFGVVRDTLYQYNDLSDDAQCYSGDEISFADKVKGIVGDSRVLNYPYDGSCFSYAVNNLNTVFRFWYFVDLDKSVSENLLRMDIDKVATDADVQHACEAENVEYVMILDYGHLFGEGVFNYRNRIPDAWSGLTSLTDTTPGFDLVLSEGDKRLYRVNCLNRG